MVDYYPFLALVGLAAAAPASSCDNNPASVCYNAVNSCGMTYGGCFPNCKPYPTFTPPPCPQAVTAAPSTVIPTSLQTICVDTIDECGQTYGGCFASTSPFPVFTAPPCTPTTTRRAPPPVITSVSIYTICEDYVDLCGQTYGGCFESTSPYPSFTAPSCSLTETTTTPITSVATITQVPTPTNVPTICWDAINSCGKTYGGCFESTSPFPTFAEPPCP